MRCVLLCVNTCDVVLLVGASTTDPEGAESISPAQVEKKKYSQDKKDKKVRKKREKASKENQSGKRSKKWHGERPSGEEKRQEAKRQEEETLFRNKNCQRDLPPTLNVETK